MGIRVLLLVTILLFCIAEASSDNKIFEHQHNQTVEGCARRGAVCTQDRTFAPEHVGRAVLGANAFLQAPMETEKCVGLATPR
uniref:Secreted protein n=1 Tax=Vitis vinifera TaxID=29760 RepID=A5BB99_VITVI|nr:hypothetical protein VITISV_031252 [Vitis vinifera]